MKRKTTAMVAIILEKQGQILLGKRTDPINKDLDGLWGFPGGEIESNEQPEEAVRREGKEELGIKIDKLKLFHAYSFVWREAEDVIVLNYVCTSENSPKPLEEHSELLWIDPDNAKELLPFPKQQDTIDSFLRLKSKEFCI